MGGGRLAAVLLDMGGVLIPEIRDFDGAARQPALVADLRALGIAEPETFIVEQGRRLRAAYRELEPERTQPDCEAILGELDADVRAVLLRGLAREETQPPFPWAADLVATLARRWRLALVSNTIVPGDHHARALERAGILGHLEFAVWSADFGLRKPAPEIIEHVLEQLAVDPADAVMVGDKIRTDVAAAHAAGVRSIWIRTEESVDTGEATPDHVLEDPWDLPALLERLAG